MKIGLKNKRKTKMWLINVLVLIFLVESSWADCYPWKPDTQVIGKVAFEIITPDDSLKDVAKRHQIGFEALKSANPGLERLPMASNYVLLIPKQFVLPRLKPGINVNLAERRLYLIDEEHDKVCTYPVSIGRVGWETPQGDFSVVEKLYKPPWILPKSIRQFEAKRGVTLPQVVPPGKENPLGEYALRLSSPTYLIHVNFVPDKVGLRSTSGCISLFSDHMEELYHMVSKGTPVHIFHQPVKVGKLNGQSYLESHQPMSESVEDYENEGQDRANLLIKEFASISPSMKSNLNGVKPYLLSTVGIPQVIKEFF